MTQNRCRTKRYVRRHIREHGQTVIATPECSVHSGQTNKVQIRKREQIYSSFPCERERDVPFSQHDAAEGAERNAKR